MKKLCNFFFERKRLSALYRTKREPILFTKDTPKKREGSKTTKDPRQQHAKGHQKTPKSSQATTAYPQSNNNYATKKSQKANNHHSPTPTKLNHPPTQHHTFSDATT